ncbi:MAG: hypothetical protein AAF065_11760 [Verrucomicrobiota bacterium]
MPKQPSLLIDGSGNRLFAGVLNSDGKWSAKITSETAPLEGLFITVEKVLKESGLELGQIRSFLYCTGPGSVLGLRLCAMAMETWSRIDNVDRHFFAYNSLQLTAACILENSSSSDKILLISDWMKEAWNSLVIEDGKIGPVEPISTAALESWPGPLMHLPARKGWQQAPDAAKPLTYEPEKLPVLFERYGLLRRTEGVELYSSGVKHFQKWTPERHRAENQQT